MTNLALLLHSPEEPQSASTVTNRPTDGEEDDAQLLELRTEAGAVYVRPSGWQRIRLQWAFRHFRVLPPQVLSRHDQRLIEQLSRSAVVTPTLPVASNKVFGVVETVRLRPGAAANRVVRLRTEAPATQASRPKPEIPALPGPHLPFGVHERKTRETRGDRKAWDLRDLGFSRWGALGAVAAVCITVVVASVYGTPLFSGTGLMKGPRTLPTPIKDAANGNKPPDLHPAATGLLPVSPTLTLLLSAYKPKPLAASLPLEPTLARQETAPPAGQPGESVSASSASLSPLAALDTVPVLPPAPMVAPATSERRFVAELPEGPFAYPVISDRNLVGELRLKIFVGADGSVKEVTVLSGSPKLAEAGVRAVRQWHYSPYQVLGSPVEVETQIKMSFFGPDAVSIASVANGRAAQ